MYFIARKHLYSFSIIKILVLLLLLSAIQLLPIPLLSNSAFAASKGAKLPVEETSFTLDGVTVDVGTAFLPGKFSVANPGANNQIAVSAPKSIYVHPYKAIYVMAVPYGTRPRSEGLPIARAAGVQEYREYLYHYRASSGENPQAGPAITLFGQYVQGETSLMPAANARTEAPTSVTEWVVEAGSRLWVVRITQEQAIGVKSLAVVQASLSWLSSFTLSSTTLSHRTTVNASQFAVKSYSVSSDIDNLPLWWNNSVCDNAWYSYQVGRSSYQIGSAHYHGVVACGPRSAYDFATNIDECRSFGIGPCAYEWECVELSLRYLYIGYGQTPYYGNGNQMVSNYPGTALVKVDNGTVGQAPQLGDVLSYNTSIPEGHTSLVIDSSVNDYGNGTITVLQQNSSGDWPDYGSTDTLNVTGWNVTVVGWWGTVLGWLHDPNA